MDTHGTKSSPIWYQIIITFTATLSLLILLWFVLIIRSRRRHKNIVRVAQLAQMPTNMVHDLCYFHVDPNDTTRLSSESLQCRRIAQDSLNIIENKLNAPFNYDRQLLQYGFIAGVIHDMRLQAVIFHEEVLRVLARIPEMGGKTSTMTLQSAFAYLSQRFSQNYGKRDHLPDSLKEEFVQSTNISAHQHPECKKVQIPFEVRHSKKDSRTAGKNINFAEKLAMLLRIHDKVRFGPVGMQISREEWIFYSEGMEELLTTVRSSIKF